MSFRFKGAISHSTISSLPIAHVASSQVKVNRLERFISDPHEEFYKINFNLAGKATLTQDGRTAYLEPGDWVIYDNMRPYELHFLTDYQQLLLLVPRSQLVSKLPAVDLLLAKTLTSRKGTGKVLREFTHSTLREDESLPAGATGPMSQMILDMLVLGLTEQLNAKHIPFSVETRLLQAKQFIEAHLHEPDLSVEMIANALHFSKRHLHTLFQSNNSTVTRYIWQQRLQKCAHDLKDLRQVNRTISNIALSWGFTSTAHFSRLFRQNYGLSPREFRQQSVSSQE